MRAGNEAAEYPVAKHELTLLRIGVGSLNLIPASRERAHKTRPKLLPSPDEIFSRKVCLIELRAGGRRCTALIQKSMPQKS